MFKLFVNPKLKQISDLLYIKNVFHLNKRYNSYKFVERIKSSWNLYKYYTTSGDKVNKTIYWYKKALITLVEAVIYYAVIYVPKDTGNLLDSLKVERLDELTFRISFDLTQAPYGIYVHEISRYYHESPTRYKFLEQAIFSAISATKINFFTINLVVEQDELSVTINSKEDNLGPLANTFGVIDQSAPFKQFDELEYNMSFNKLNAQAYLSADRALQLETAYREANPNMSRTPSYGTTYMGRMFTELNGIDPFEGNDTYASILTDPFESIETGKDVRQQLNTYWASTAFFKEVAKLKNMKFPTVNEILKH